MKTVLTASLMLLGFYCLAQNGYYQDSLQIEIGSKARILFQARDKSDFELIKRYDLNKLFEELLERSATSDSAAVDALSLVESKKFINQQQLKETGRKVKEIFLRFNYGLYAGLAPGQNIQLPVTTHIYTLDDLQGKITLKHGGNLKLIPALMTLGISMDAGILLKNHPRLSTELKLTLGYERTDFQKDFYRSVTYSFQGTHELNEAESKILELYYDKITGRSKFGHYNNYQQFSQFYLQFMPQIELKNQQGKRTWRLGVGIRGVANLQPISGSLQSLSIFDHPTQNTHTTLANLFAHPYLWSALGRVSYKSIGIFVNYTPRALTIQNGYSREDNKWLAAVEPPIQYFNSWVFGLRWGIY